MRKQKALFWILALCAAILMLSGCSNSEPAGTAPNEDSNASNSETEQPHSPSSENVPDYEVDTAPKHEYLDGYQDLAVYRKIDEIEKCTSPEELSTILAQLYGEEISFTKIEYDENGEFLFQVVTLYDVQRAKAPVTEDVYAFFTPYNETPVFIMDSEGAYPVSKYEINSTESGKHYHHISAWLASDLFLCLHEFTDCEGDIEERSTWSEAVRNMDWYMEYEARIMLLAYQEDPSRNTFGEVTHEDTRAELLIPVMDGTLSFFVNELAQQALDICERQEANVDLTPLYENNDQILVILNSVRDGSSDGGHSANDLMWDQFDSDLYQILMYTEDFITTAGGSYNDQEYAASRITEYKALCDEFANPVNAAVLYLKMK